MQTILALECAHEACSAAVWKDGRIRASEKKDMERGQAEALFPMILRVMAEAGCGFDDVNVVAVTIGPGSFTGVRVGLAAARGIAMAAGIPMVGISVLEGTAFKVSGLFPEIRDVYVVLETRRDDFYVQRFSGGRPVSEPAVMSGEALKAVADIPVAGNGALRFAEEFGPARVLEIPMPDAADVAVLASARAPEETYPSPLYLREAEVSGCRK